MQSELNITFTVSMTHDMTVWWSQVYKVSDDYYEQINVDSGAPLRCLINWHKCKN